MKRDDTALVKRAKSGDGKAYDDLIVLYKDAVFSIIYRMVHNKQEAEDLAQLGFPPFARFLPGGVGGAPFDTVSSFLRSIYQGI